ncbi:MAG: hydroxyacylglutathione hydrolase [Gallionella sp.]|nr:hydroxyacylglutathione hydrolase [Gallionella sp.]
MFNITAIPAFQDNYIWAIHNKRHVVVVDPGDAVPVLNFLTEKNLELTAILCTHRHNDHIGGIAKLRAEYHVPVYGRSHPNNPHITEDLREGEQITLPEFNLSFGILEIPGHLDDHIAFVNPDILFCGDVLFGAGCGRNKEGTLAQLHHSLQRLSQLPDETRVYCAHEYTTANIQFALACEPSNLDLQLRSKNVKQLRAANIPSLPSTVALEKSTNPFLRCTEAEIIHTLQHRGLQEITELSVFTALREWRNVFTNVHDEPGEMQ